MNKLSDGCKVQRKDKPGVYGEVSKSAASVAGLFMNNPEWNDDASIFIVFDDPAGINMGWYHPRELEVVGGTK